MSYIDIHTHLENSQKDVFQITNVQLTKTEKVPKAYFSVGWHPWDLYETNASAALQSLEIFAAHPNCIAIGECGIDRSIDKPIAFQKRIFLKQIKMAAFLKRPVIVHCVKAYSDLLEILKLEKIASPLILHGYKGNEIQTAQLLKFNVFFSFGEKLLHFNSKKSKAFSTIPFNRIFFETDTSPESIENIYLHAAKILGVDIEDLKLQITRNFKDLFGDGLVE